MPRKLHAIKEIREALEYAIDRGFRVAAAGKSAHAKYRLLCPLATADGCDNVGLLDPAQSPGPRR